MQPDPGNVQLARLRIRQDAKPPRRTRRTAGWIAAALCLGVAAAAAWLGRHRFLGVAAEVETGLVVRTGGALDAAILTANGYVTARRQAGVTAKVTGRIARLHKDLGDRVAKDEVLAELEINDLLAALEELKATLWVSELEATRARRLAEDAIGSQAEADLARARFQESAARVKNIEEQIENTKVRAPFDGIVIVKNGEVGETVSLFGAQTSRKSGPIFVIADFHEFEVEADVNEANIGRIEPGQPAEIALDAVPDRKYPGRLRQIVPTADRQKATIQVKVTMLEVDAKVFPEMSAKVTFVPGDRPVEEPKVLAPVAGITARDGRKVALILDGDIVREVPVETGPLDGGLVRITKGLSGGESIVLSPSPTLEAGQTVRPRPRDGSKS